jgi:hypothetical protein
MVVLGHESARGTDKPRYVYKITLNCMIGWLGARNNGSAWPMRKNQSLVMQSATVIVDGLIKMVRNAE